MQGPPLIDFSWNVKRSIFRNFVSSASKKHKCHSYPAVGFLLFITICTGGPTQEFLHFTYKFTTSSSGGRFLRICFFSLIFVYNWLKGARFF